MGYAVKSLSHAHLASLAAIVTIAASGFAIGAAATSDRSSRPVTAPPTTVPSSPSTTVRTSTSDPVESVPPTEVAIAIVEFAFDPPEVTAVAGSTIIWSNDDDVTHNVFTSDELLASADLERGDTYSITLQDATVIDYYCDIHQYMRGTITVTP